MPLVYERATASCSLSGSNSSKSGSPVLSQGLYDRHKQRGGCTGQARVVRKKHETTRHQIGKLKLKTSVRRYSRKMAFFGDLVAQVRKAEVAFESTSLGGRKHDASCSRDK